MLKANGFGLRRAALAVVCGITLGGNAALAGALEQPAGAPDRYQVFFGDTQTHDNSALVGRWQAIDYETRLLSNGPANYDTGAIGYSGPAGVSYFTPRLKDVGLGVGLSGQVPEVKAAGDFTNSAASPRKWRLGGTVGTSTIRVGAAFGDHPDPACRDSEACNTNDFWDIGVAWRFGSGALSAGYTASQRRLPGVEDRETLGIFSVSAGYRIAPGLDVFGGIDWIELPASDETQETPRNTRFMLGTSLRF